MKRLFWSSHTILFFLVAVLVIFLIVPIGFVFKEAFTVDGQLSIEFFRLMFSNTMLVESIWNSLKLGLIVTAMACIISIPISWVVSRYDFYGKVIAQGMLLVPIIMPPFVGAIGIQRLFAQYGAVNMWLLNSGILEAPIDFFGGGGFWGVVLVQSLSLYPIMYLNLVAAIANIDPSLEEAALSVGATRKNMFRKILLPLMRPGFFAGASIVFIWSFTDLGTPLMFNLRNTMPVQVFNMVKDINANPMGFVMVVTLLVMAVTIFLLSKTMVGKTRYEMLGRGHVTALAQKTKPLGSLLINLFLYAVVFIALMPHIGVILNSVAGRWVMTPLPQSLTTEYFGLLGKEPLAYNAIKMSLMLSVMSTIFDIVLGVAVAYVLVRKKFWGSDIIDSLVMLPLALPGVVIAFGYVATFSGTFLDPRYNPVPLLVISYAIRRLPYMVRSSVAGFQQTPVTLEEASQSLGAGPIRTSLRITMPLVAANLIAGAMLCFAYAMLEVSDSMILAMKQQFFPITKAIYVMFESLAIGVGLASAMGVVGMLILTAAILGASRVLGKRLGELFRAG